MTILTDTQGNLIYTQTGFVFVDKIDATLQELTQRLRLLNNEYLLGNEGLDYPTLMSNNNVVSLEKSINSELAKDPRVAYTVIEQKPTDPHSYSINVFIKEKGK